MPLLKQNSLCKIGEAKLNLDQAILIIYKKFILYTAMVCWPSNSLFDKNSSDIPISKRYIANALLDMILIIVEQCTDDNHLVNTFIT